MVLPWYLPIIELLKQYFQIDMNASHVVMRHTVMQGLEALQVDLEATAPYLLHLLDPEEPRGLPLGMSPEAIKRKLFESLRWLLLKMAARHPLILAIEDLHWADQATIEFLTFLLEHIAGVRILLVCTYRPDFVSAWSRKSYHSVITLQRLASREGRALLTVLLSPTPVQDDLAAFILDKAEGVPFFLEELVSSLREAGAIAVQGGQWVLTAEATTVPVPDSVEEILMARIDRLPEEAKRVLQMGAVIGREFGWGLLKAVSDLADHNMEAHLGVLTQAELLYERGLPPQATYLFKHAFTQEAAYRSLLTTRRCDLHHRVAVVLETLFSDRLEDYYGLLARHYLEAAQPEALDQAIDYAVRAGERHVALPAYVEAARFYKMALQALERRQPVDASNRCALLLTLGKVQHKAGEFNQALDTLQQAAACACILALPEELARAALDAQRVAWYGGLPMEPVVRLLEEAYRAFGEAESALRAKVLGSLATALLFLGVLPQAAAHAQQAVEMARRVGDPAVLAFCLGSMLFIPWGPEETEQRLAHSTEMLRLATAAHDDETVMDAHNLRVQYLIELGNIQEADRELAARVRRGEELQEPFYLYINKGIQATLATMAGHFAESERLLQQSLSIGQRLQADIVSGTFGLQMFTLRREQGRLKEIEPAVTYFVQQHTATATWRPGLALIYSELGRRQEAREIFETLAQHDFADLPRDALWMGCMSYLADVCTFLGDAARATTLYQLLLPHARRNVVVGNAIACYGAVSRYLGMLATTMRRWEEAAQHFEAALVMNARMGARPWLAHTQHQYGVMLLTRNQPGDREKVASLLAEAQTTAGELGMHALEERLAALLDQRVAVSPVAPITADELSQREHEVLRLIAIGKSNREIAETLCISLNTVASHVKNILTKTNTANRTEAAAYAMRYGLVS